MGAAFASGVHIPYFKYINLARREVSACSFNVLGGYYERSISISSQLKNNKKKLTFGDSACAVYFVRCFVNSRGNSRTGSRYGN